MAFDGGGGAAEGFGDDGHGCEFGEFVMGQEVLAATSTPVI